MNERPAQAFFFGASERRFPESPSMRHAVFIAWKKERAQPLTQLID